MMDQDRITQYIHSLDQGHGAFCDRIAKDARAGRVPIIRKETASFLQAMVAAKQPENIRQPVDILPLGRIHEDKIKRTFKLF